MNCQQFQENLPHTIDSGGSKEEEAHLRSCPECASVVQDLKYIANQARLLLPMHDPSPRVWQNIQSSLRNEGLISEGRTQLIGQKTIGQIPLPSQTKNWTPLGWALGLAAVLLLGIVLVNYRPASDPQQDLVQYRWTGIQGRRSGTAWPGFTAPARHARGLRGQSQERQRLYCGREEDGGRQSRRRSRATAIDGCLRPESHVV